MRGSIRAGLGFLVCFAAVGGMDTATDSVLYTALLPAAVVGLLIMASGVNAMKGKNNG